MLTQNKKREIKELIHKIECCYTMLATLEPMRERLYAEKGLYTIDKWAELEYEETMKIAKLKVDRDNARQRLRELGVY